MAKTMLIDATQPEETRVAVLDHNGRLEEFDLEITSKQQIKGDIYLAKITRVEPSLQAAFVNFGGNRHGFLPFSEIHPDYYRIPVADREALQAEIEEILSRRQENDEMDAEDAEDVVAEVMAELEASAEGVPPAAEDLSEASDEVPAEKLIDKPRRGRKPTKKEIAAAEATAVAEAEIVVAEEDVPAKRGRKPAIKKTSKAAAVKIDEIVDENEPVLDETLSDGSNTDSSDGEGDTDNNGRRGNGRRGYRFRRGGRGNNNRRPPNGGGRGSRPRHGDDDEKGDIQSLIFRRLHRRYKIQEVIKRGQIVLVQATKEERGNKGAAMTSYLSLPGRSSVLMPNSPRSGGVSRKIFDRRERDRLKDVFSTLEVPDGMSVILRTAGVGQSSDDIHRDYDYLQKTWGQIREKTMSSTAPAKIYQEGSVIKRAIRDIFREDISEIVMSGEKAIAEAKEFMTMLVPTEVKKIKQHKAADPLFVHYKAEEQIAAIDNHTVTLKSGGYLVFSPTEALVAIDINSGRATRERHIEETALNTNLEAAEEIARQMRLRDLGGLVVIDFIDMEDHRHNVLVERKLESALANDRARIQVGRISQFGLLELSRQRLRPSLTESHFMTCPHCQGLGIVRNTESAAIVVLRAIAQEGSKGKGSIISITVPQAVCLYLLNNKRDNLTALEERYNFKIELNINVSLGESQYLIERVGSLDAAPDNDNEYTDDGSANDIANGALYDNEDVSEKRSESREGREGRDGGRNRNRRGGRNRNRGGRNRDDDPTVSELVTEVAPEAIVAEDTSVKIKKVVKDKLVKKAKMDVIETPVKTPVAATEPVKADKIDKAEKAAKPEKPVGKLAAAYETVNEAPEKPKKGWWRRA